MTTEFELSSSVEEKLREAKLDFKKQAVVGDARPDFIVTTQAGDHIVIEVKAWGAQHSKHCPRDSPDPDV